MENILEELNEGVIIVDDQLRIIFANEALVRLGHYERSEIQGHTPDAIFPAEDLPHIMRQHEVSQRYGRHRSEFYFPRKDGEKIPAIFSARAQPLKPLQNISTYRCELLQICVRSVSATGKTQHGTRLSGTILLMRSVGSLNVPGWPRLMAKSSRPLKTATT